jgi:ketosteroid isomerase-like protein
MERPPAPAPGRPRRPGAPAAGRSAAGLVRDFYAARAREDLARVRALLAPDVVWHEAGSRPPYTGRLRGRRAVLAMIAKARALTGGTFRLRLHDVLASDAHAVALVQWSATRGGRTLRGREVAVYHVRGGRLAEAWFHPDRMEEVDAFWAEPPARGRPTGRRAGTARSPSAGSRTSPRRSRRA